MKQDDAPVLFGVTVVLFFCVLFVCGIAAALHSENKYLNAKTQHLEQRGCGACGCGHPKEERGE